MLKNKMDIIETIVSSVVARRALLFEQFYVTHAECWPGFAINNPVNETLTKDVKCSCGAWFEATILAKVVSKGFQPK